jgi:hypothetical protein
MKCICGNEFTAKRSTQRYCSRGCQLKGIAQGDNSTAQEFIAQGESEQTRFIDKSALPGQPGYDGIYSKPLTAHCIKCNCILNEGLRMCYDCATDKSK